MKTTLACIPCFVRQAHEALDLCVREPDRRAGIMRELLEELTHADWNVAPVILARNIHRAIRAGAGHQDPYAGVKQRMNQLALELLPALQTQTNTHPDRFEAIVRIAIAGNLLDSGAKTSLTDAEIRSAMGRIFQESLCGSAAALRRAAHGARQILFLADNSGEIVFDRLLLENLPAEKMFAAVRGSPIINDATLADAEFAGLPEIIPVLDNGSDAPGTIIEDCSQEFRELFKTSDLIIAKGQGNYESLSDTTKHIFFLLRVKCPYVAGNIGAPVGCMVVREQNSKNL